MKSREFLNKQDNNAILKRQSGGNDIIWRNPRDTIHTSSWTPNKAGLHLASKVENITFTWSRDTATGEEYGLLAEIIGDVEYTHLTNLNWAQETEPVTYDSTIQATTATHRGREWKKNGTRNAHRGSSGKDSFAESPWTRATRSTSSINRS